MPGKTQEREKVIQEYFDSWRSKDVEILHRVFAPECLYIESYGPAYKNLNQICQWFKDWNEKGQVLEWNIRQFLHQGDKVMCEWHFKCRYEGENGEFDGVSIINFNQENKIIYLKEFQSKLPNTYPYSE